MTGHLPDETFPARFPSRAYDARRGPSHSNPCNKARHMRCFTLFEEIFHTKMRLQNILHGFT